MHNSLLNWSKWALISVYLVIFAGSVVRMTGSGMGCPDWPKCFGYLIPPTEREQLDWKTNNFYEEGNVIILDNTLQVATKNFQSGEQINMKNWEQYTKHDYTTFNTTHTWVEFINRLLGAIAGLVVLGLFVRSFWWIRRNPILPILAFLAVLGMGVQAWLGKTVVDSNLLPSKISLHMIMALIIVGLLLLIRVKSHASGLQKNPSKVLFRLILFSFVLTLFQFALGIDVRQYIDLQIETFGYNLPSQWLQNPEKSFYIHRSLSIVVVIVNFWIYLRVQKERLAKKYIYIIIACIFSEIALGIAMYYVNFPWGTQPLHLIIAALLFSVQLYWLLRIKIKTQ